MIITIGNTKGGTGKSTLATNLAVIRSKISQTVILVDADEQHSSLSFSEHRSRSGLSGYTTVALTGKAVSHQVPNLCQHYQDVIIDVGGRDSISFRAALTITQILIIPVQPRTFDVWAMEEVAELVERSKAYNPSLQAYSVLNMAEVQGRENAEAAALLREYAPNIAYIDSPIMRRKVYPEAVSKGKGVVEVKPINRKAIDELNQLADAIWS